MGAGKRDGGAHSCVEAGSAMRTGVMRIEAIGNASSTANDAASTA